jgi:hypothetical protein
VLITPDWRTIASLGDTNRRTHHAATMVSDTLYVLGGYGGYGSVNGSGVPLDSVISLNLSQPSAGAVARAALPAGAMTNLGAVNIPGTTDILVAGGYLYRGTTKPSRGTVVPDVWRYSTAPTRGGAWRRCASRARASAST